MLAITSLVGQDSRKTHMDMTTVVTVKNENGSRLIPLPAYLWKLFWVDIKKVSYEACKDDQGVYLKVRVRE